MVSTFLMVIGAVIALALLFIIIVGIIKTIIRVAFSLIGMAALLWLVLLLLNVRVF